jgi:hypothetical protein
MRSGLVATTMVEDTETTVGMVEDMVNLAVVVGLEAATSPDTMEDTNTKAIVEAMDQDTVVVLVSLETVVVLVNLDMVVGKAAATGWLGWMISLIQNMLVVSAGKVSLVSALQADTIYTIRKRRSF